MKLPPIKMRPWPPKEAPPEARPSVEAAGAVIREHLAEIARLFVPGMKLTFIARMPGKASCDLVVTDDDFNAAAAVLVRSRERERAAERDAKATARVKAAEALLADRIAAGLCPVCGDPVPESLKGPARVNCSRRCTVNAADRRRKKRPIVNPRVASDAAAAPAPGAP